MVDTNPGLIADRIGELRVDGAQRSLIAVAGPPASGKSSLAEDTVAELARRDLRASVLPMDGFHLDNAILERRGLLSRKGAPETFDFDGFLNAVRRVRCEPSVMLPDFDRDRDVAVAGALEICRETRIILVEGNYLLLDEVPWSGLNQYWDLSVYLSVPIDTLERRLRDRWHTCGLAPDMAMTKIRENDLVNAELIMSRRGHADIVLAN